MPPAWSADKPFTRLSKCGSVCRGADRQISAAPAHLRRPMDFDLTPEQQEFRDTVREWVNRHYSKEDVRALEADEGNFPEKLWQDLAEAGFHGIGIDEAYGGQGGDSITQSILAR